MTLQRIWAYLAPLIAVSAVWLPRPASACGGTFCDVNRGVPVNQAAETVLFSVDEDHVEVHIQFNYTGDPQRFGWVIPVPAEPTFEIGSQALFDALDASTRPVFSTNVQREECDDGSRGNGGGGGCGGFGFGPAWPESGMFGDTSDDRPPNPDAELVGSFEVEILRPQSVAELEAWLDENDYQRDEDAPPIFAKYIEEGHLFAGLKLRPGAGIDELHPIVMRYPGDEPCIPLRLTRIAAEEDMGVRAYFAAEHRVVPLNYRHVEINPRAIDWAFGGANYEEVVALAVDEGTQSPGRAFVTEYAGPPDVVARTGLGQISLPAWIRDLDVSDSQDVGEVLEMLERQGVLDCSGWQSCAPLHPLIEGILLEFLPPPPEVAAAEYYGCPTCYDSGHIVDAWNAEAFFDALQERIVDPVVHARVLLLSHPTLTRLYTRISPEEMLADPVFVQNPDLPPVAAVREADVVMRCDGVSVVTFDDARELVVGSSWPAEFDELPAERVELMSSSGAPVVEDTFRERNDEALVTHNEATIASTGASVEAVDPRWGGGHEPEEGCGSCRTPKRDLQGALWLGFVFAVVGFRRRR